MRILPTLLAGLVLAGCDSGDDLGNGGAPAATVAPPTDAADAVEQSADQAVAREFAWTGRFAASPDLCETGAWDIGETRIATAGETNCDVTHVARAADSQVTLALTCTAEGMPSRERWTLSERGEGINVRRDIEGAEGSDVDLVRC